MQTRIKNLQEVLAILNQKEEHNTQLTDVDFYVVKKVFLPRRDFWCSDFKWTVRKRKLLSIQQLLSAAGCGNYGE
ncbi:MAG: hypothetical protein ACLSH6_05735 [Limosilactobacillus pontis]